MSDSPIIGRAVAVAHRDTLFSKAVGLAIPVIVAVGVGLRVVHFARQAPLWNDEIALVNGILAADVFGLVTRPLPFDQAAPVGCCASR